MVDRCGGAVPGLGADLISQEVADKVGKVWGLGSDTTEDPGPWEGEQRNMRKPTKQEALWFHGATCTSRGTTRCTWRYSSRPGTRGSRPPSTASRRYTT